MVVEVQRQCGCSYQFREAARAVLRSAKGVTAVPPKRSFPLPASIPRETPEQQQERAESGVQIALEQLCSKKLDSQLIGMESLEHIARSGSVSKKVLEGSCLEKVLAAAQEDSANARSDMEEQHMAVMKRRAMTVLANALCSLAQAGELDNFLQCCSELKSESFVCCLVDTLRDASKVPHEAAQAARCMQHLMAAKEVETILVEMSAIAVVSDACHSGACHSALLEQESKKLKLQLSSV